MATADTNRKTGNNGNNKNRNAGNISNRRGNGQLGRGPRNPFAAAATAPDTGGIVARSTLPKPVTLVLDEEQALTLHRLATRALDETLATLIKRKIDWTEATNAKLAGQNTPSARPPRHRTK